MPEIDLTFRVSDRILGNPYFSSHIQGLCKRRSVVATRISKKRVPGAMISVHVNDGGNFCPIPIALFDEHPPVESLENILKEKGVRGGSNSIIVNL